jgi:hypothetical protein
MLTAVTELPEYIRRASELLSEAERKAIIDYLAGTRAAGTSWKEPAVFVNFVGRVAAKAKAVASESFTTTTTTVSRSIYLLCLEKMKNRTSQNPSVTSSPSWLRYFFKSR